MLVIEAVRNLLQKPSYVPLEYILGLVFRLLRQRAYTLPGALPCWFSSMWVSTDVESERHLCLTPTAAAHVREPRGGGARVISSTEDQHYLLCQLNFPCAPVTAVVTLIYTKPRQPLTKHLNARRGHGKGHQGRGSKRCWATSLGHPGVQQAWKSVLTERLGSLVT